MELLEQSRDQASGDQGQIEVTRIPRGLRKLWTLWEKGQEIKAASQIGLKCRPEQYLSDNKLELQAQYCSSFSALVARQ
jgi:hypothetical protein